MNQKLGNYIDRDMINVIIAYSKGLTKSREQELCRAKPTTATHPRDGMDVATPDK